MRKTIILFVGTLLLSSCKIQIEPGLKNPFEYINAKENNTNIYTSNNNLLLHPFNFAHIDFGRLLLINIEDHPRIKAVELVVQKDAKGSFVVIYYKNGKVESYPNQYLSIDKKYLKPNDDWTIMPDNDYNFDFNTSENNLNVTLNIEIKNNIQISIGLQNCISETENHSLLAAIGANLSEVKRFPLVYLEQAGFISVGNTKADILINGKSYPLTKIPIPVEGIKCYKTVYSFNPQPFFWNEENNGNLSYIKLNEQKGDTINNTSYTYINNSGHPEIKKVLYQVSNGKMSLNFAPALPDFLSLADNIKTEGKFSIDVNENNCVIGGSYYIERVNNEIIFRMNPERGWQANPGKSWVSFYDYEAHFDVSQKTYYHIQSVWSINK